jgi:nucleoside phosphorylase/tetratricopeptide (TPR) repeat protein
MNSPNSLDDEKWKNHPIDIGIIIALKEEFAEFHKHIKDWCNPVPDEKMQYYYYFDYPNTNTDKKYRCVATFIGDMGHTKAALRTKELVERCNPNTIVMLGIAGGISNDVMVGDVVTATQVDCYLENSKAVEKDDDIGFDFELSGEVYRPSNDIINLVKNLEYVYGTQFQKCIDSCANEIQNLIPPNIYSELISNNLIREKVFVCDGHVASGPTVGTAKAFIKWLKKRDRKYLALEMESGGMMTAVYQEIDPKKTLILRGISDYADERKNELDELNKGGLRRYAMYNAIQLLWCILNTYKLPMIEDDSDKSITAKLREAKISLAKLPPTSHDLFGREKELEILDKAWNNPQTNIVSIVAFGGTGKTALVNTWLNKMAKDKYKGAERVLGWSFYSQGTSEDKQASADQFIAYALGWFGDPNPNEGSPWDKGERLAELVKAHKTLLILDGLEPLQYPPGEMEGKLRDPSIEYLLKELAHSNKGLCIITTRIQVDDIKDDIKDSVEEIELENLSPEDGAKLLETLGVDGIPDELKEAVVDLDGHALALTLLGTYLKTVYRGDIRRRKEIPKLTDAKKQGAHARRVMESYEIWLKGKPELDILYIMGLFDRPAEWEAIQAVREKPVIEGLTSKLENLTSAEWRFALDNLRTARLLSDEDKNKPNDLDCHPLVREHFGEKLKANNPKAWKEAHNRLYLWYKSHAKERPDTLEGMTPLYQAVSHGCHAGRWQEALDEVYAQRILRVNELYSTRKLGAFGSNLSAISGFFSELWSKPVDGLSEYWKAFILNEAGFLLRGLGRLSESAQLFQVSLEMLTTQKNWKEATIRAYNLNELYLTIGDIAESVRYGEQSVELADKSGDAFMRMISRTALVDALHQNGMIEKAETLFKSAEYMQKESQPEYPILSSLPGYCYCDLLLGQGKYQEVLRRAGQTLEWSLKNGLSLLTIALDHLSLGRAYMLKAQEEKTDNFVDAEVHLQQAVDGIRQAGQQQYLPLGLLARASLYIIRKDYNKAQHDVDSAFSIASRGSMGLHLADCHLAYARLYYAKDDSAKARKHLATAKEMINRMGYHRRDKEVEELENS